MTHRELKLRCMGGGRRHRGLTERCRGVAVHGCSQPKTAEFPEGNGGRQSNVSPRPGRECSNRGGERTHADVDLAALDHLPCDSAHGHAVDVTQREDRLPKLLMAAQVSQLRLPNEDPNLRPLHTAQHSSESGNWAGHVRDLRKTQSRTGTLLVKPQLRHSHGVPSSASS